MRAKEFILTNKSTIAEAGLAGVTGAAKTLGKAIPFVGAGVSGLEAYDRFKAGDYPGAAIASAGVIPALSWPAMGVQAARDKMRTGEWFPDDEKVAAAIAKDKDQSSQIATGKIGAAPTQAAQDKPVTATTTTDKTTQPASVEPKTTQSQPANVKWQDIYKKNIDVVGKDPNLILPGQVLNLPDGSKYTVKPGDSLSKIAQRMGGSQGITAGPNKQIDQKTRQTAIDWTKQQLGTSKPTKTDQSSSKVPSDKPATSDQSTTAMASSGKRHAADLNNPTGLGWNGKTWAAFDTPEEGVAATQRQLSGYLAGRGVMKGRAPTPENVVSMWVSGGSRPAEEIQGGAYVQSVKNELARSGVKLGPKGEIPNTPEATLAITRAMVKHETAPKNQGRFQAALYPERQQVAQKASGRTGV